MPTPTWALESSLLFGCTAVLYQNLEGTVVVWQMDNQHTNALNKAGAELIKCVPKKSEAGKSPSVRQHNNILSGFESRDDFMADCYIGGIKAVRDGNQNELKKRSSSLKPLNNGMSGGFFTSRIRNSFDKRQLEKSSFDGKNNIKPDIASTVSNPTEDIVENDRTDGTVDQENSSRESSHSQSSNFSGGSVGDKAPQTSTSNGVASAPSTNANDIDMKCPFNSNCVSITSNNNQYKIVDPYPVSNLIKNETLKMFTWQSAIFLNYVSHVVYHRTVSYIFSIPNTQKGRK